MSFPLPHGKWVRSPGQNFAYQLQGPVCRLYDREDLPWPSCSLQWRGKQPSWNRVGKRFVPDLAASQCHSYAAIGFDRHGNSWNTILTIYYNRLTKEEKHWWITKKPTAKGYPGIPDECKEA